MNFATFSKGLLSINRSNYYFVLHFSGET
jgi:hypothetical protein